MNLYFIQRPGKNYILSSEKNALDFFQKLEQGEIRGYFGSFPSDEVRENLKGQLYYKSDYAAEKHFHEKDFILRYSLSLLIFLFLFFLFSYVVKDPIPFVDEAVLSFAGAILFNLRFRKKRNNSEKFRQSKLLARNEVDNIPFDALELLGNLELYLQSLDEIPEEKRKDFKSLSTPVFLDKNDRMLRDFYISLGSLWSSTALRKEKALLKTAAHENLFEDLSLLVLYLKIRDYLF